MRRPSGPSGPSGDELVPLPAEASLGRDMGVTLFANIYGSIVALLVSLIAARTLSLVDFGRLSWILTTAYLLGALGTCGATLSVIAHRRSADTAAADSFDRASLRLAVVAGCTLAIVLTFVGRTAPQVLGRNLATVAAPAGVLGAVTALVITVSAVLRSRRRFVLSVILSEQLLRTGALIGVVAGWLAGRATVSFVAVTMVTWAVCVSVALAAWVHRAWPMGSPAVSLREVAARSMPFFVGSIGTILIPQAGVWTLGAGKGPEDVAVLSVAIRISMMCSLFAVAMNRSLGPRIGSPHKSTAALTKTSRESATVTFLLTAALASPMIVGGPWLTALVFGDQFRAAWAPAVVLLGGLLVSAAAGPCGLALYNSGHERLVASRVLAAGVVYVGVTTATASYIGALGVATLAAVTVAVLNLWQARTVRRLTSVVTWTYTRPSSIRSSIRSLARSRSHQQVIG